MEKLNADAATKRHRDKSSARQRKRRQLWAEAVKAAGWGSESQLMTAVIAGMVTLPNKTQGG